MLYCFYFICAWKLVKKLTYHFFAAWIGWLPLWKVTKAQKKIEGPNVCWDARFFNSFFCQLPAKDFRAFGVALEPTQMPRVKDFLPWKSLLPAAKRRFKTQCIPTNVWPFLFWQSFTKLQIGYEIYYNVLNCPYYNLLICYKDKKMMVKTFQVSKRICFISTRPN